MCPSSSAARLWPHGPVTRSEIRRRLRSRRPRDHTPLFCPAPPGAAASRRSTADTLQHPGDYVYQVLPAVEPAALLPAQIRMHSSPTPVPRCVRRPTAGFSFFLRRGRAATLARRGRCWRRTLSLFRITSELPDLFLEHVFRQPAPGLFPQRLSRPGLHARGSCRLGHPRQPLSGWLGARCLAAVVPGLTPLMAGQIAGGRRAWLGTATRPRLRVMPTPPAPHHGGKYADSPFVSTLRLLLTKSVGVVKELLRRHAVPAALLALALRGSRAGLSARAPSLRRATGPGGHPQVEMTLFLSNVFDRIRGVARAACLNRIQPRPIATARS